MLTAVLVGCGAMSVRWLEAIAKIGDLSLVGLVDLDGARAQARAAEFDLADDRRRFGSRRRSRRDPAGYRI